MFVSFFVRSITQKRMVTKVLGLKGQRSRLRLRLELTAIRHEFEYYECPPVSCDDILCDRSWFRRQIGAYRHKRKVISNRQMSVVHMGVAMQRESWHPRTPKMWKDLSKHEIGLLEYEYSSSINWSCITTCKNKIRLALAFKKPRGPNHKSWLRKWWPSKDINRWGNRNDSAAMINLYRYVARMAVTENLLCKRRSFNNNNNNNNA